MRNLDRHARLRRVGIATSGVSLLALLAGCGASSTGSTTAAAGAQGTAATAAAGGPGGGNSTQFAAITKCLNAAGISMPTPPARPSGAANGSGSNTTPPSAAAGSGNGSGPTGTNPFSDTKVVAALKACGITVPSAPAGGPGQNGMGQNGTAPSPASS